MDCAKGMNSHVNMDLKNPVKFTFRHEGVQT